MNEGAKLFRQIQEAADGFPINDSTEDEEFNANDEIEVGVLPDYLKRLWSFLENQRIQFAKSIDRLDEVFKSALDKGIENINAEEQQKIIEAAKEALRLKHFMISIMGAFWLMVEEEFDLFENNVGIRKGWKVVKEDKKTAERLDKCFGHRLKNISDLIGRSSEAMASPLEALANMLIHIAAIQSVSENNKSHSAQTTNPIQDPLANSLAKGGFVPFTGGGKKRPKGDA